MLQGAAGLIDHRRGIYRKVTPEIEKQIVQCKLQKPERSARWIRNRLKLAVSVETVRSKQFRSKGLRSRPRPTET
jgi:hypothetical protein